MKPGHSAVERDKQPDIVYTSAIAIFRRHGFVRRQQDEHATTGAPENPGTNDKPRRDRTRQARNARRRTAPFSIRARQGIESPAPPIHPIRLRRSILVAGAPKTGPRETRATHTTHLGVELTVEALRPHVERVQEGRIEGRRGGSTAQGDRPRCARRERRTARDEIPQHAPSPPCTPRLRMTKPAPLALGRGLRFLSHREERHNAANARGQGRPSTEGPTTQQLPQRAAQVGMNRPQG